ncbi:MAG TPA: serine protease [Steroidobacteraceae bacterium]|nr:serine protease [Steroidobacteraceae bacterium]
MLGSGIRRERIGLIAAALVFAACLGQSPARAASLSASTERAVRAGTFEVVQLKPPETGVQYDRPLPLELIPFQQRVDKYRSIGTAFAIGHNRYVTASHVLITGLNSQFGPPALRDGAGNVYAIDQVVKFSDRQDFAEFSLVREPPGVKALPVGSAPALNDTVFAVGNALGEGIVVRDGLYTSDTPEEINGDWKWLRFSAAASPGNSGGPLVDQRGRVIGVVLRKTEAENLNYALPIQQVVMTAEGVGKLEGRAAIRLPIVLDTSETSDEHDQFKLPLALPEFYRTVLQLRDQHLQQAQAHLIADNSTRLFPNGSGSEQLLHMAPSSPLPRFIRENQDGIWGVIDMKPQSYQLDNNGFVRIAGPSVRLRAPDDVALSKLYGDSRFMMDLLLKGYTVRRQVGSDSVRVTSLGAAQEQGSFTDRYDRTWLIRSWPVPYDDSVVTALCLPTPEGYDLLLVHVPNNARTVVVNQLELLTNYLYLSLTGTLSRWQDYLSQPVTRPGLFKGLQIDVQPDQQVHVHARGFDFTATRDLVPLTRDSVLELNTSFYRNGPAVVWDLSGLTVAQSAQQSNYVQILRVTTPPASMPQNIQVGWHKMQDGEYPFDGKVANNNGNTFIRAVVGAATGHAVSATDAGGTKIEYVLTVVGEGDQAQQPMSAKLALAQRSFQQLEH